MSKKKKLKLTTLQKRQALNLLTYVQQEKNWAGEQDLKEVILGGPYVVLSVRAPIFDIAIGCGTLNEAQAVMKYNPDSSSLCLDTTTNQVVAQQHRAFTPSLEVQELRLRIQILQEEVDRCRGILGWSPLYQSYSDPERKES